MLKSASATRAPLDGSPTGKMYANIRGLSNPHKSVPFVLNRMAVLPLCTGKTTSHLSPICTVLPVVISVARRYALNMEVPSGSVLAKSAAIVNVELTGSVDGPDERYR